MNIVSRNINLIALKNAFFYDKIDELSDQIFIDYMSEFDFNKIYLAYFIDNLRDTFVNAEQTVLEIKNNCIKILNKFYELDTNNSFSEDDKELYLYWCFSNFTLGKVIDTYDSNYIVNLINEIQNVINKNLNNEELKYAIISLRINILTFYNLLLATHNPAYYDIINNLVNSIKEDSEYYNNYRIVNLR